MGCECEPDLKVVGMQRGEEVATALRLVAVVISVSIVFPWLDGKRRQHMHLFCMHWVSGVVYVVTQLVMSVMVLLCWSSSGAEPFIYFLKFTELTSLNVWSISSVAIALLIVNIVRAFEKCRRVPAVIGSRKSLWGVVIVSLCFTICSVFFWEKLMVTGAYFWVTSNDIDEAHWITMSFAVVQLLAGFMMLGLLTYTIMTPMRAGLIVCCRASKRVRYYFYLTIMGILVYTYGGIALLFDEFAYSRIRRSLVMVGWSFKYVHVICDTFILMGALWAHERMEDERLRAGSRENSGSGTTGSVASGGRRGHCNGTAEPTGKPTALRNGVKHDLDEVSQRDMRGITDASVQSASLLATSRPPLDMKESMGSDDAIALDP